MSLGSKHELKGKVVWDPATPLSTVRRWECIMSVCTDHFWVVPPDIGNGKKTWHFHC